MNRKKVSVTKLCSNASNLLTDEVGAPDGRLLHVFSQLRRMSKAAEPYSKKKTRASESLG